MTFLITGLTCLFQIKVRLVMSGKAFLLELQSGSFTRLRGLVLTSQMCSNIVAIILIDMIEPMKITNISIHRAAGILWSLINTTLRILPCKKYLCFGVCFSTVFCFKGHQILMYVTGMIQYKKNCFEDVHCIIV